MRFELGARSNMCFAISRCIKILLNRCIIHENNQAGNTLGLVTSHVILGICDNVIFLYL